MAAFFLIYKKHPEGCSLVYLDIFCVISSLFSHHFENIVFSPIHLLHVYCMKILSCMYRYTYIYSKVSNHHTKGKAFQFSKSKMIMEIIIPSLKAYFKTGLITVFSFGWKLVVMGEVLSASTGLGARITDARMNLETL